MKIGILGCIYNDVNFEEGLKPFQGTDFVISVVSAQFKEYSDLNYPNDNEKTLKLLKQSKNKIKYLYHPIEPKTEAEARNLALEPLLEEKCDYIWLWDSDEKYSDKEINNILKHIEENKDITWFSINFKNYVFTDRTWVEGFCPPRIFKNSTFNGMTYNLSEFYFDNDVNYFFAANAEQKKSYKEFSHQVIPRAKAFVKHLSWSDPEISKKKCDYQKKHFNGVCSYRWNKELDRLEFNPEYYKNQPYPELNYE